MRIAFFPLLIKQEEAVTCHLKNCPLVIDGQNFFFSFYEDSKIPYYFGSEANELAKYIRKKINIFRKANIECYVVFKGGNTDMKRKITHRRNVFNDFVPPIFSKDVWIQVLDEIGVKYSTCLMECKDDCVALANALNCPVLSNDIEYCFRNVPYIPHTTIDYTSNKDYVQCNQYSLKDFLAKHSLTDKKMAIFAALSDRNEFPHDRFEDLFKEWKVHNQNIYLQIKNLLKWLSEQNEEDVLSRVSTFFSNEEETEIFSDYIERILEKMHRQEGGIVTDYLLNPRQFSISSCDPHWFAKGVATHKIPHNYINLYKHKCIVSLSNEIENVNVHDLKIKIYLFNLLTNYQGNKIQICIRNSGDIKEVDTDICVQKPVYECVESVFENGWNEIKHLKLFEFFLNHNGVNTDLIKKIPPEARMLFITITYFARRKSLDSIDVAKEIHCFIVSYVMLHIVFDKEDSLRKKKSGINEEDSAAAQRVTEKYFKVDKDEAMSIMNHDKLKTLQELQYCLLHMNHLNCLCGSPFMATKYHRSINATFIYKLLMEMTDCGHIEFIENLFKTAPTVLKFIKKLQDTCQMLL